MSLKRKERYIFNKFIYLNIISGFKLLYEKMENRQWTKEPTHIKRKFFNIYEHENHSTVFELVEGMHSLFIIP